MVQAEIMNIDDVEILNKGIIKKAKVKFVSGLNVIVGENASGKTTLVEYLLEIYAPDKISERQKIFFQIQKVLNSTTLIFDDLFGRLNTEDSLEILKKLSLSKRQVILTINSGEWSKLKNKIKANVIYTASFT